MATRAALAFLLLGSSVLACSSEDAAEETFPAPKDDVFVAASEQTKRETGVAQWGVTSNEATATSVVHGYAANNKPLVELRHQAKIIDDTHVEIAIELSGERGHATMRIGFAGRPGETEEESYVDATMLENTFVGSDANTVLTRMRADTGEGDVGEITGGGETTVGGGGSLVSQSLTPREGTGELVQRCAGLLGQCGGEIVRRGASTVANTEACRQMLTQRGITLACRTVGGLIGKYLGRLLGGAAGTAVGGPVGTAVGGAAGGQAGKWLGEQGCRYVTGNTREGEQQATQDCIRAASDAVMSTATSSQQCRDLAASCRP